MPQEPLTWDRFKERRYDRPPPDSVGPGSRWRESSPHHAFRGRIPGNGRPVPWRYPSAESEHGFSPSRINGKFIGDEGFHPSGYRMESRYNRFNRENSDSFVHKDMRGHAWENGMSPNNLGRPHFGSDRRSVDDRSSFRQKDIKGHFSENGRMQNGSSQRALDDKGSFGRRDIRGKSREKGVFEKKDSCSIDDKEPFEKKSLKRRSPEDGILPYSSGRPHNLNDQRSLYEKRSYGEKVLRGKNCETGVLPNRFGRMDTVHDRSSVDDKDMKGPSLENSIVPNVPARIRSVVDQSSGDDMPAFTSPTHSDLARAQGENSKDQYDKSKLEKQNSLGSIDWKPLKWTRSGSLTSRVSEQKTDVPARVDTPLRSPTGDAATCATMSAVSSEETGSRKKTRLGWGEGLAKFEKKKVEGPVDDSATKPGLVGCGSGEPANVSNLAGRSSPRVSGFLECASPATPSSVAFSSSPGNEDKACLRSSANLGYESSYSSGSPYLQHQESTEGNREKEFCLENVDFTSIANLSPSLTELIQSENAAVVDFSLNRSNAMEKLNVWRCETVNALEAAEAEIDLLENDLMKLDSESAKSCEGVPSSKVPGTALPLVVYSPGEEKTDQPLGKKCSQVRSSSVNNAKSCEVMDCVIIENLEEETVNGSDGGGQLTVALSDDIGESLCDGLFKSNKESGIESNDVFNKLLPSNHCGVHGSRMSEVTSWKDDVRFKKKNVFKKRCGNFDLRVNTLKYRALQHLWKKDLQLKTSKEDRPKSKKRLEINLRGLHGSNQKHRSSRSRLSNSGKLSLAPTPEAIKFTRKLLSDSRPKPFRDSLKMPALMDAKERITSKFVSNNGLVEDPCALEKQRSVINPWTKEEKGIFMDKLATFGKDFNKISSFLEKKTTADCVEFYYKNHKSDEFVQLKKKKPDLCLQRKSYSFNNYLVGSGKRFSRETNAASLDVLGEASAMAAMADSAKKTRQEASCSEALQIDRPVERSCDLDVSVNEREAEAANVLAGICSSIPSSAKSSCVTSSVERRKKPKQRVVSDDDDSCSDGGPGDSDIWTDEEVSSFIQGVSIYGQNFEMLSRHMGRRSSNECMLFYLKTEKRFGLSSIRPRPCDEDKDDNNGGGSNDEGACVVEADTLVSGEKMVVDASPVVIEPEVVEEGETEMENGYDDEPMETDLHPEIEEHRGGGEALSPEESPSVDVVNGHGSSGSSCGEDGTVDPVEARADDQEMAAENSSNSKEDENSSSDMQEAKTPTNLTDLNCVDVDQELSAGADVLDVAAGSNHIQQIETIDLELNTPLEEPVVSSLEGDSCPAKGDSPPEAIPSSSQTDVEMIAQKLDVAAGSNHIQRIETIDLELNTPLEEPVVISLEGDSCPAKGDSPPEAIPSSSQTDVEMIAQKSNEESSLLELNTPLEEPDVLFIEGDSSPENVEMIAERSNEKSSLLVGYPIQMAGKSEMQGCLQRCSASDKPISAVESPIHSLSRHRSCSSPSDSENPKRTGNVILFGQVLKPNSSASESPNLEIVATPVESSSGLGNVEHVPSRSFAFWNGNAAQVGYPSAPDSAILLAKYPAAFANFSSSSNMEQQHYQLYRNQAGISEMQRLNAVGVEMTGGKGGVDYHQLHRNQLSLMSEMQLRNGIVPFSGLRNPLGVVGTSVGISDPVDAIKMHYANVEKERRG